MKLAYVYDAVWPYVKGGTELRINELAKRLGERGHEVDIFGLWWWFGGKEVRLHKNVTARAIGKPKTLYGANGKRRIREGVYFGLETLLHVPGKRYDVVDVQEFPYFSCFGTKLRANHNLVITFCEIWGNEYWRQYLGAAGKVGTMIERMTTKLTDKNVAVSEHVAQSLKRMSITSTVIMNGVDYNHIQTAPESSLKSDIIFVGRLIKEKNVDLLLDSLVLLKRDAPKIRCTIVGDGPERKRLEAAAKAKKVEENVAFTGFVESYDNLLGLMKSASVLAFPSQREGFGFVALEANACGIPFVTIRHPMNAAAEFCEECKNGYVCNPTAEEFADYLAVAMDSKEDMAEDCRAIAQRYDWNRITDQAETYYEHAA